MRTESRIKVENRLKQIEDRKIEILLEISKINNRYEKDVSVLNKEYERLHKEHYDLQVKVISKEH